jgi:RNA polymerase sigma-70 factor, ECF subfamily
VGAAVAVEAKVVRTNSTPPQRPPDLATALQRARTGDQDAFRTLYGDIQPRLLRYLRLLVHDEVEDIAAETWLHIIRHLHTFRGGPAQLRTWAVTIARNRALDFHRRRQRNPVLTITTDEFLDRRAPDNTEATAMEKLSTESALALIATLPPDQAEAVLLRAVMGLSAVQAGRVLGKSAGAVRTASYRGLQRLATDLNHQG